MNRSLKAETLARLAQAIETGDLDDAGLNRLCDQPFRASLLYADVRELWMALDNEHRPPLVWPKLEAVTFVATLSDDHGECDGLRTLPSAFEHQVLSYTRYCCAPWGEVKGLFFKKPDDQSRTPLMFWTADCVGGSDHVFGGIPYEPLKRYEDEATLEALHLPNNRHEVAVIRVGEEYIALHKRETVETVEEVERTPHTMDAFCLGSSVFLLYGKKTLQLAPDAVYRFEKSYLPDDAFVSETGAVLYRDKTHQSQRLVLDGKPWVPCGLEGHSYGAFGFFADGTPYGVCTECSRVFTPSWSSPSFAHPETIVSIAAYSTVGPFLVAEKQAPDPHHAGTVYRLFVRQADWSPVKELESVSVFARPIYAARAAADGSFAVCGYSRGEFRVMHYRSRLHRSTYDCRDWCTNGQEMLPASLSLSPDGQHVAWVRAFTKQRERLDVPMCCMTVDGQSGRYHEGMVLDYGVHWDCATPDTRMRYVIREPRRAADIRRELGLFVGDRSESLLEVLCCYEAILNHS